jgi:AcrR family transcriptional regulator
VTARPAAKLGTPIGGDADRSLPDVPSPRRQRADTARVVRTRDPARKQRILAAAADLVARNGFHAVSMEDIGEAVGITASAIYRHYESKTAVLVAMFDRVIDQLLCEGQQLAADPHADPRDALIRLIDGQIDFVVVDRDVAKVYFREIANLPDADQRNLRRKQRLYLEEWVHQLTELRPDLDDTAARTVVHCAIGAIQSTLQHSAGLPEGRLRELLRRTALAVLTAPSSEPSDTPHYRALQTVHAPPEPSTARTSHGRGVRDSLP